MSEGWRELNAKRGAEHGQPIAPGDYLAVVQDGQDFKIEATMEVQLRANGFFRTDGTKIEMWHTRILRIRPVIRA